MNKFLPADYPTDPEAMKNWLSRQSPDTLHQLHRKTWNAVTEIFPFKTPDTNLFWQLVALTGHLSLNSSLLIANLSIIRLLTDTLRKFAGQILHDTSQRADSSYAHLMIRMADELKRNSDMATAMTWIRRSADLLNQQGNPTRAYSHFTTVTDWCSRMTIHNLVDRGQMLDEAVHNFTLPNNHPIVVSHMENIHRICQVEPEPVQLPDYLLLLNSAAQIQLTLNRLSTANDLLRRAMIVANQWTPIETLLDQKNCLLLRVQTTQLRCFLLSGDLASADIAYNAGSHLLNIVADRFDPIRMEFQLQAGEFLYRIRSLTKLEKLFSEITADEKLGLHIHPKIKAQLLTNWAMVFRERHRFRLANFCHSQALSLFDKLPGQQLQSARIKIQYAKLKLTQQLFNDAGALLNAAEQTLSEAGADSDLVRLFLVKSSMHLQQEQFDKAKRALNHTIATHTKSREQSNSLALSQEFQNTRILWAKDKSSDKTKFAFHQARQRFIALKSKMIHYDHRLSFYRKYRKDLARRVTLTKLSIDDRVNGLLEIIENDRADIFSTALSYLVKASNRADIKPIYEKYLHLRGSANVKFDHAVGISTTETQQTVDELHGLLNTIIDQLDLQPEQTLESNNTALEIQQCMQKQYSHRNPIALAYVLRDNGLSIAVIPGEGYPQMINVELDDTLHDAYTIVRCALLEMKNILTDALEKCIDKNNTHIINWRQVRDRYLGKFRQWRRQNHNQCLRRMVEASDLLIEAGLIYQRLIKFLGMGRRNAKYLKTDGSAYTFLYQLLIRPIENSLEDNSDIVIFVSEILSQIPFEALRKPGTKDNDACLIFPKRTVNYFRSPALFCQVMKQNQNNETSEPRNRAWFTPLIPSEQNQNPYAPTTAPISMISNEHSPQHDLWFRFNKATTDAFEKYAPTSRQVLLETHCTFDRNQPFLSRLIFALSKPMTIMDILARVTFRTTSLLILAGCESDRTHDYTIDQASISIAEAMISKGALQVIATKWLIQPHFSRTFIKNFNEHIMAGESAMDALANTQREISQNSPHPGNWASFSFSGKPDQPSIVSKKEKSL